MVAEYDEDILTTDDDFMLDDYVADEDDQSTQVNPIEVSSALDDELALYENFVVLKGKFHYGDTLTTGESVYGPFVVFTVLVKTRGKGDKIRNLFLKNIAYGEKLISLIKQIPKGTFVKVTGTLDKYEQALQVKVRYIEPMTMNIQMLHNIVENNMQNKEKEELEMAEENKEKEQMEVEVDDLEGLPIEELVERAGLDPDKLIVDEDGNVIDEEEFEIDESIFTPENIELMKEIDEEAAKLFAKKENRQEAIRFLSKLQKEMLLRSHQMRAMAQKQKEESATEKNTNSNVEQSVGKTEKTSERITKSLYKPRKSYL